MSVRLTEEEVRVLSETSPLALFAALARGGLNVVRAGLLLACAAGCILCHEWERIFHRPSEICSRLLVLVILAAPVLFTYVVVNYVRVLAKVWHHAVNPPDSSDIPPRISS